MELDYNELITILDKIKQKCLDMGLEFNFDEITTPEVLFNHKDQFSCIKPTKKIGDIFLKLSYIGFDYAKDYRTKYSGIELFRVGFNGEQTLEEFLGDDF